MATASGLTATATTAWAACVPQKAGKPRTKGDPASRQVSPFQKTQAEQRRDGAGGSCFASASGVKWSFLRTGNHES